MRVFKSLYSFQQTFIQRGAERRSGGWSHSRVCFGLHDHAVLGRGLQVSQDDTFHFTCGCYAALLPLFKLTAHRVVLSVVNAVTSQNAISEVHLWRLVRRKHSLFSPSSLKNRFAVLYLAVES